MASLRATIVALACALAIGIAVTAELNPLSDAFIDLINSQQTSWKAGRNFAEETPMAYIINLAGVLQDKNDYVIPNVEHDARLIASLPECFDAREKWTTCPSLSEVRDQGACGSCWALGAVAAMTDRVCIYSNGTQQVHFSAEDLVSCCHGCIGCVGGIISLAWKYWVEQGLVSGGNYNSSQGCRSYSIPECEHDVGSGKKPPCGSDIVKTPKCIEKCDVGYSVPYEKDKHYGKSTYGVNGEDNMMAELYTNGPVEASFTVYADFIHYKSGVYKHVTGDNLGGHAIKIIGWGIENGMKYWLITNSWNEEWGDHGYFKILRGENHCGIEGLIVTGEPLLN